jgi:hypothetical protein
MTRTLADFLSRMSPCAPASLGISEQLSLEATKVEQVQHSGHEAQH